MKEAESVATRMTTAASSALLSVARCLVCGEEVTLLEAPLHAEDHAQRGEFPPSALRSDVAPGVGG
jgi:hypothetical protein